MRGVDKQNASAWHCIVVLRPCSHVDDVGVWESVDVNVRAFRALLAPLLKVVVADLEPESAVRTHLIVVLNVSNRSVRRCYLFRRNVEVLSEMTIESTENKPLRKCILAEDVVHWNRDRLPLFLPIVVRIVLIYLWIAR